MSKDNTEEEIVRSTLAKTANIVAEGPKSGTLAEEAMEKLFMAIEQASPILGDEEILRIVSGNNGKNGNKTK